MRAIIDHIMTTPFIYIFAMFSNITYGNLQVSRIYTFKTKQHTWQDVRSLSCRPLRRCPGLAGMCGLPHPLCTPSLVSHTMAHKQIYYSVKYFREHCEYRHVVLSRTFQTNTENPSDIQRGVEKTWFNRLQRRLGWVQYVIQEPNLHILLFR